MQAVIDGILTNYEILGSNNPKDILILHGWGQSLENWRIVAKNLNSKYRVILLDLPGFGSSSFPGDNYHTADYSEFVSKFINKLDLSNLILIGHSLGGKIAIKNSATNLKIKDLFLISPSGINDKGFVAKIKIFIINIFKFFTSWLPKKIKDKLINIFASSDYSRAGRMRKIFKNVVDEKVIDEAKKIIIPTVIIWGENDQEVDFKTSKILKSLIKNSTLRVLWGLGHSPNIESPKKLTNLLFEYL